MGHLHMIRNHRPTMSMMMKILQYTFFLIVCLWMLYQVHQSLYVSRDLDCDFVENKLVEDRIAQLLGRKGGIFGKPHYSEELELYGVDLIGEAVFINNITEIDDNEIDNRESDDQGMQLEQVETEEVASGIEGKKDNSLMSELREDGVGGIEIESLVKVNGVILKKDDKLEILKFIDENGVSEHESGPSRRSDVEVKSARKGCISKAENKTNGMEESQNVCSKRVTDKHRVPKLEREGVEKEMPEMVTVKSTKGSMRDLLLSEM